MNHATQQKLWFTFILVLNAALWLVPSDVVEQIARDRHTMLGRYSRQHFSWNVGILVISLISIYLARATGREYVRRWFRVLTASFAVVAGLVAVDRLIPSPTREHYIRDGIAYRRPPGETFNIVFEDKPEAYRTYPNAPPGYGRIECTLRTDARGFRNPTALEQADVVTLGDSFAEGSNVSDEQAWPRKLSELGAHSVYNLGMSGYDPPHYLGSLKQFGLALRPRHVICMIYEGNDFRSAKSDRKRATPGLVEQVKTVFKQSPIINGIDSFLINTFGPIRATAPVAGAEVLDWMPLAIPEGSRARHYAFAPKQLRDLYQSADEFAVDKHWLNPRSILAEMKKVCDEAGAEMVLVVAPTKAHVTMPMVADRLSPGKIRAFTMLDYDDELPEANTFLADLIACVEAREEVVGGWARQNGIKFVSLVEPLRDAARAGTQVYYTYDQHWTPGGHEVVARHILSQIGAVAQERAAGDTPP